MDLHTENVMRPQVAAPDGTSRLNLHAHPGRVPAARPTESLRSRRPIVLAFGVALFALMMWTATTPSRSNVIEQLPAGQRVALFHRTLDNVEQLCSGAGRPRDFCREQATLLLRFPECGPTCVAAARRELAAGTAVK